MVKIRTVLYVSFPLWLTYRIGSEILVDKEAKMTFVPRCNYRGYDVQKHFVTTDDNYVLQVFRIKPKNASFEEKKPSVMLQHGYEDSSFCWIVNKEKSPAFVLADKGYDVWMGNNRGNKFSKMHVYLDPETDKDYWNFSFEEMGMNDDKAVITHIKEVTGNKKIAYMGLSQGTTQMFYALAQDSDWFKDNLGVFIALAPVTRLSENALKSFQGISRSDKILFYLDKLGLTETFFDSKAMKNIAVMAAKLFPSIMDAVSIALHDADPKVNSYDAMRIFWYHGIGGSSYKAMRHWRQIIKYETFNRYDYGKEENLIHYGQEEAPLIDIGKIHDVPIALFVGKTDVIVPVDDAKWTRDHLRPDVVSLYKEYDYGHVSFLTANDMSYLEDVDDQLRKHLKAIE